MIVCQTFCKDRQTFIACHFEQDFQSFIQNTKTGAADFS